MEAGDVRAMVEDDEQLVVERGIVRAVTQSPVDASPEAIALVAALDASPFSPPDPSTVGADPALVAALVRHGVLVDIGGVVFTRSAVDRARELVREHLATNDRLSVGDARDRFASSRKYVVPLLEHFDREGVTRRRGDVRIAGPTLGRGQL
jgi:selenocysteine-specific elongation factor